MSENYTYNFTMPKDWTLINFAECCKKISLNGIKIKQKEYQPAGKFPVVDQGQELIGGYFDNDELVVPGEPPFIIFGDHTKVKKYINFKFIAGADGVKVLKPYVFFNAKLIYYFIHCVRLPDKGYARHFQFLEKIECPIPPLLEQDAIVSKIEQIFSELDKGIESLKAAQQQLKVYRQSVLKWAFEGKLTEKWRQNQALPDAQELLEKIQKEREEKAKAGGKKLKPVPPLTKEELAALPQLSKGWGWVRLGEAGDIISGQHILEGDYNFNGKGLSYLTGPADFGPRYPTVTKWTEKPKAIGKKNGILITVKGAGVGKVNILNVERAAISRQLMSFESDRIKPEFGFYYLLSQFYAFQKLGLGSTVPGIDRESLLKLAFPLCASAEQHQIVQEIESRLSECDNMEATITASLQQAEALRQSILKKAFEGKLLNDEELEAVRQDPTWEPAERLLERIREEKAGLHSGKKGRKSKA